MPLRFIVSHLLFVLHLNAIIQSHNDASLVLTGILYMAGLSMFLNPSLSSKTERKYPLQEARISKELRDYTKRERNRIIGSIVDIVNLALLISLGLFYSINHPQDIYAARLKSIALIVSCFLIPASSLISSMAFISYLRDRRANL